MIALVISVSVAVLVVAQIVQPHPQDVHTFYIWFQLAFDRGIFHIYDWTAQEVLLRFQEFSPNYPPFIFSLYPLAALLNQFHMWPSWPSVGANLFFRIPLLLGQLFICFSVYRKLKMKNPDISPLWAGVLLFLNPAFIVAGPIWGQLNFLLWGTLALSGLEWENDNPTKSALWAALGAIIKPQFIMFVPLLGFLLVKKRSLAFTYKWLTAFLLGVLILCSPFLLTSGLDCLAKGYIRLTGGQYAVADIGYNFWWTLFSGLSVSNLGSYFLGVPYSMIATLLGNGLVAAVGFFFCFRNYPIHWINLASYTLLTLFCFLPGMNPQCLVFGLGFFTILALKNASYRPLAILLSLIQCLNLAFNAFWTPNTRFYLALSPWVGKSVGVACFLGILWAVLKIVKTSISFQLPQIEKNQR